MTAARPVVINTTTKTTPMTWGADSLTLTNSFTRDSQATTNDVDDDSAVQAPAWAGVASAWHSRRGNVGGLEELTRRGHAPSFRHLLTRAAKNDETGATTEAAAAVARVETTGPIYSAQILTKGLSRKESLRTMRQLLAVAETNNTVAQSVLEKISSTTDKKELRLWILALVSYEKLVHTGWEIVGGYSEAMHSSQGFQVEKYERLTYTKTDYSDFDLEVAQVLFGKQKANTVKVATESWLGFSGITQLLSAYLDQTTTDKDLFHKELEDFVSPTEAQAGSIIISEADWIMAKFLMGLMQPGQTTKIPKWLDTYLWEDRYASHQPIDGTQWAFALQYYVSNDQPEVALERTVALVRIKDLMLDFNIATLLNGNHDTATLPRQATTYLRNALGEHDAAELYRILFQHKDDQLDEALRKRGTSLHKLQQIGRQKRGREGSPGAQLSFGFPSRT